MKSMLVIKPHNLLPGESIVEVWHKGQFIATVAGADGPGVRVISKHEMRVSNVIPIHPEIPGFVEVEIEA